MLRALRTAVIKAAGLMSCLAGALMITGGLAKANSADDLDPRRIYERMPEQICFDLVVELTSRRTLETLPPFKMPLCLDSRDLVEVPANPNSGCSGLSDGFECARSLDTTLYRTLSHAGGSNPVRVHVTQWQGSTRRDRQVDSVMVRWQMTLAILTHWDLWIKQVLEQNGHELPTRIAFYELPSHPSRLGLTIGETWRSNADAPYRQIFNLNSGGQLLGTAYDTRSEPYDLFLNFEPRR